MRLGVRALARELGVSAPLIVQATKSGRITRGEDGLYDVEACRAKFKASHPIQQANARKQQSTERAAAGQTSVAMPAPGSPDIAIDAPPTGSLAEAVLQEKQIRVARDRAKLLEQLGSLVQIEDVDEYIAEMHLKAKDVLLRMPAELKSKLAQISDENRIEALLLTEIYRALGELAAFRPSRSAAA